MSFMKIGDVMCKDQANDNPSAKADFHYKVKCRLKKINSNIIYPIW